jgi:hypothetical protein
LHNKMLVPIDQYKKSAPRQQTFGKLKPLAPKPARAVQRPDIRQSENYKNAVASADRYKQEATKASSFRGMATNALKSAPQATADVMIGTPAKFIASAIEAPEVAYKRNYTDRTYKVPGLTPFKSFQSDYGKVADDVISGKKGMGSAAWELAKIPLAGLETAVIGKGLVGGARALAGGNVKKAGAIVSDAFLPTNFSTRASSHTGLAPLPRKSPLPETQGTSQLKPLPPRTVPLGADRQTEIQKVVDSYSGNTINKKGVQRGFIESVKNSPEVSQDLAARVQGTYQPKANIPTQEKAQRLIFDNVQEAERVAKENIGDEGVITGNELIKHYDSIAQKAKASGDMATFEQAMSKATDITETQARNLTEAGRTVQAASTISRMSPEGMLHYINKVSKDFGTEVKLSPESTYDFMRKAEEIQNILDPRERAFKTFDLIDDLAASLPKGKGDKILNALNLPRAIMSTGDLSAPLRQGVFTAARHPITFGKNFGKMMKYAFSEDSYRNLKADIITSPNYNLYVKHGLPLTDIGAGLTGREEAFMSNLAEKIPLFGKLANGSNRAYTGFLNKMRVDLFDDFVNTAKLNGITDQKYFDDAAKFVGSATGRGSLPKMLEGSAPALNSIFFSPRLMASRISLINPAFYMKLEPTVRKEALKSLGAFVGTGMSILALAKANGADVSTDPRSADFGKIKMGNTRYDIWGGFQQYARLIGQLATGEKISTITGKETTLGQGYNAPTRKSILGDFFQSKTAPIASLLLRGAEGEKYGEKFNLPAEVLDRFLPMVSADAFDLYKEYGAKGVAGAIPGFFGVGSQTYGDQIPTVGRTDANNPTVKWRSQPGLGETILNKFTGNEISNIPKDQWGGLYEERKQEQIRQAEVDKVKQEVLITGNPKYVGNTLIFLDNGVVKTKKIDKVERTPLKKQVLNPFFTK